MAAVWSQQKVIEAIRACHARGVSVAHIWRDNKALVYAAMYWFGGWRAALEAAGFKSVKTRWSKEAVVLALRTHPPILDGNHRWIGVDRNLRTAARRYFGDWQKALVAAGLLTELPQVTPPRTAHYVVEEIRGWQARGVSVEHIGRQSRPLVAAAISQFGSWRAALRAAGFESTQQQWSKERIIDELRRQYTSGHGLHRPPKWDSRLKSAAKRHFGSLHQALVAAKLRQGPPPQQRTWTREQVIEALRACQQRSFMESHPMGRNKRQLYSAAKRLFGSWREAQLAAGLQPRRVYEVTREDVIRDILEWHRSGKPLVWNAREKPQLYSAAQRLWGGWHKALNAAGIATKPCQRWTKAKVINAVRQRASEGPPLSQVWKDDKPLFRAATHMFGNWSNTLTVAGLDPRPYRQWSIPRVIDALRGWYRQQPCVIRRVDPALADAAYRFFGSTLAALEAAGLDPPPSRWTKRRIIQAIQDGHVKGQVIQKAGFGNIPLASAAKRYFGSWRNAVSEAGLAAQLRPEAATRSWSPQAVIDEIVNCHRQGKSISRLWKHDTGLYSVAKKHFGSWRAAVLAAGLEVTQRRWTRELAIEELQAWHARSHSLSSTVLFRDNSRLGGAVIRLCGSWSAALVAAGLIAERPTPTTTKRRKGKKACSAKK
jgi:hypothetical protein